MRGLVASLVVFVLVGCAEVRPPTQVMVTVVAEPGVRARARQLQLEVFGGPASTLPMEPSQQLTLAVEAQAWPRLLALAPQGRDATRRFRVDATARDAMNTPVATARVVSGYVEGRTLAVTLTLFDACLDVDPCDDPTLSCGRSGECEPAEVDPRTQPDYEPDASVGLDAGGGMDAAVEMDASMRMDATIDEDAAMTVDGGPVGMDAATTMDGGPVECTSDAECMDPDACTIDACATGRCTHEPSDCSDGDRCTDDMCMSGMCIHTPNAVCSDAGAGGCVPSDCNDGDRCTDDMCMSGMCIHTPNAVCSDAGTVACVPADCDDMNRCTTDTCRTGLCSHAPVPSCCNTASDCSDGNACTSDVCSMTGTCTFLPIDNCCTSAVSCSDGDACTIDECIGSRCVHTTNPSCMSTDLCLSAASCDDGNPCTVDDCLDGVCSHVSRPTCRPCAVDTDCDDMNNCTRDMCASVAGSSRGVCQYGSPMPLPSGC